MVELFDDDFDCWEWFQSDKERILRSLARKNALNGRQQMPLRRQRYWNSKKVAQPDKIPIERLMEIVNLQPLGMFLYLETETELNFFVDQIDANDNLERVLIYTRILVILCELKLPGFHYDLLKKIAADKPLIEHYETLVKKLCTKSFRTMWTDLQRVDNIICYMQTLLLQAFRANVLDADAMQMLFNIWTYLKNNENPTIKERPVCLEFLQQLEGVFSIDQQVLDEPNPAAEIYPTLDEIQMWLEQENNTVFASAQLKISYVTTIQYINSQRLFLRQQFLIPLRELVRKLQQTRTIANLSPLYFAFENVEIRLNRHFPDAHNSNLIFVDLLAAQHKTVDEHGLQLDEASVNSVLKLKIGSLLCLSTSYDFPNLILATVSGSDINQLRRGYIAITIVQQYNIGNIYGQKLIMFETPVYFEPYQNAYRYLTNSNVINFPMADYIVHGLNSTQLPDYLNHIQPQNFYDSQKFLNKVRQMPLNASQKETFNRVLKTNFNLIQGPPGTGKTHLSLQLVNAIVKHAKLNSPVVVITYTNDSLDKFLLKLSAFTSSIVRFGCQSRLPEIAKFNARSDTNMHMINPRLKRLYWMVNLEIKQHFKQLQTLYGAFDDSDKAYAEILTTQRLVWNAQEKLNCIRTIFQHYLIIKKNVLAMTTTCAARMNFIFRFLKSRIVIFEEAAEILEAHLLPCLTPYTEHVIMIGDHMQLKPYTSYIRDKPCPTLSQSLFERLIRGEFHVNILNIQYRMRDSLAEMLCPLIYRQLFSHESVYRYPPVRAMSKYLYFLDHSKLETQLNERSLCNNWEVQKVIELVRHFIEVGEYNGKDIVVLSPYTYQVELIKQKISKLSNLKDIHITTVDSFQGLEADIIVLSLVRSNIYANIGFLSEKNRICVAISRARLGLYMIGNMKNLAYRSPTWNEIQKKLKLQNAIGIDFPYDNNNHLIL